MQVGLKPSSPPESPEEAQADAVFAGLPDVEAPAEESVFSGALPDEKENKEVAEPPPIEPPEDSPAEPESNLEEETVPAEIPDFNDITAATVTELTEPEDSTSIPSEIPADSVVSVSIKSRSSMGVPKILFFLLMSYASAVTIALVILGMKYLRNHPLESLPDVVPKIAKDGKISFNLYPEDVEMPRGHVLQLGEMQRFGNLEVTPVKITRGPAILVSTFGNQTEEEPTEDVLKLWLHIKNVSKDQTFPPLGRRLVRTWSEQDHRANQFVCLVDQKKKDGDRVLMYDLGVDDTDLALKGQQLDYVLRPGKEYDTFLATTDEGLETLKGKLVWRVHFRKGYNPESRWGVTTLIEINFDSDEIINEASSG
jgi:hypothetical protein